MIGLIFLPILRRKTLLHCTVFSLFFILVSSLPNEDVLSTVTENTKSYCSQESCQELRERVESLEAAVRAIVFTLSDKSLQPFTAVSQKLGKNRAVQSVLSAPISTSEDVQEEAENSPMETPYSPRPAKPINYHQNQPKLVSNSVHQFKHAVKCSLAHMLDIHVSENDGVNNHSAGILNTTLVHQTALEKYIEIEWSPPLPSCIEFITGLWIRVYESSTNPTSEPYLSIPKKCLKSKHHPSGRETLSILLPSSNSSISTSTDAECTFPTQTLIFCRSYQVEVVPDYQSLKGKCIRTEIIVPPTMETMNRLEAYIMNVSALVDSLALDWEDNSSCASHLTSINLRLWLDGVMIPNKNENENFNQDQALTSSIIDPIIYRIPSSCLFKQVPSDGRNRFSLNLSSKNSCSNYVWKPLEKCRKYTLEMESQYSSAWNGPPSMQTVFISSVTPDHVLNETGAVKTKSLLPSFDYTGDGLCSRGFYCQRHDNLSSYQCVENIDWLCDYAVDCRSVSTQPEYRFINDESYCDPKCLLGFRCGTQCIPAELVCDGKRDCYIGDEEINCPDSKPMCQHYTTPSGVISAYIEPNSVGLNKTKSDQKEGPTTLLVSAKPNQVIWLDFAKLSEDKKTIVKIYDGPYSSSPLLLFHDDYQKPSSVRSSGPNLCVEYYSYNNETQAYYTTMDTTDDQPIVEGSIRCGFYVNGDGFIPNPDWRRILNGKKSSESLNECYWYVEARHEGGTVLLKRYNSERDERNVSDHRLSSSFTVYDGWKTSGAVLYDDRVKKRNNDIIIYSFSSKILIFTPNCREHFDQDNTDGLVKSPNFPASYPRVSDCHWTITGAPGSTIRLLFSFFETQENEDFVYVYDGPTVYHPLLMKKSGLVSMPFVMNSSSNQMLVRFTTSDVGRPLNGFLAVYSAVQSNPLLNRLLGNGIQTFKKLN